MFYQQVKLYDIENESYFGGIAECEYTDAETKGFMVNKIICACCGSVFDPEDWDEDDEDAIIRIVCFYPDWIDFSEFIIEE